MKRLLALVFIMALTLAACDLQTAETTNPVAVSANATAPSSAETVSSPAETSAVAAEEKAAPEEKAPEIAEEKTAPEETTPAVAEIAEPAATTTVATTTASNEPAVCGTYRSVEPVYDVEDAELEELIAAGEDHMLYDYIDIEQHDDGRFQAQFMLAIGSSGNDFAVFETESLGTAYWYSFYFDGDMGVPYNNGAVTITPDGDSIWVTFEGGEAYEFIRTE
jgi:flagellar biosynthesis GTPase FlhF